MAIDPMMYERLSGRKGDPYTRMGEALAQSDSRKHAREEEKHVAMMARSGPRQWRMLYFFSRHPVLAISIFVGAVLFWGLIQFLR